MRLLLKLPVPTPGECEAAADPHFGEKLNRLLKELGATRIFSRRAEGRLVAYALFEIADPARIFAIAKPIATWLKVKPEFFPETVGKSYFGDVTLPEGKGGTSPGAGGRAI